MPEDADARVIKAENTILSDRSLGIEKPRGGLKRNGVYPLQFTVPELDAGLAKAKLKVIGLHSERLHGKSILPPN